jgi:uncharacterized protein (TIGR02391 family)
MILTPDDLNTVNNALIERHRLDPTLARRCGDLINQGHYPAAVQQAFTVLEDRLREKTGASAIGLTSNDIIKTSLASARAPLAESLHLDSTETAALRDLLSGLFRFYRNPAAHTLVEYEPYEAQALLSMINLLLRRLDKVIPEPKTKYEPFFRAVVANLPRFLPPHLQHASAGPTTEEKSLRLFFPGELVYYFELFFRRSALEIAYHAEGSTDENKVILDYFKKQLPVVQTCFAGAIVAEAAGKGAIRFGHYWQPKPDLTAEMGAIVAEAFARLIGCIFPHALAAEQRTKASISPAPTRTGPPSAPPTPAPTRTEPPTSKPTPAPQPLPPPRPGALSRPTPAPAQTMPVPTPAPTPAAAAPPATYDPAITETPPSPQRRRRRRKSSS